MSGLRALAALALLPPRLAIAGVLVVLDVAIILADLRAGDRAGKWGA